MDLEVTVSRAQIYGFYAEAFLYPRENWSQELDYLKAHLATLGIPQVIASLEPYELETLQRAFCQTFGLSGSLCYETEYGLPHEFRMSQELADIAGFYRAFGVRCGGAVQERPDHIAVECEFMHLLCLKEAWAAQQKRPDQMEICQDGERKFLGDHLGKWLPVFVRSLELHGDTLFVQLARQFQAFLAWEAQHLGIQVQPLEASKLASTPIVEDWSCAGCSAVSEMCPSGGVA